MKHFVALLLLFLNLLCGYINPVSSSTINTHNVLVIQSLTEKYHQKTEIYNYVNNERALLRRNNDSEIYTSAIKEICGSGQNYLTNNIFSYAKLYKNYGGEVADVHNREYTHLEHEICARAP